MKSQPTHRTGYAGLRVALAAATCAWAAGLALFPAAARAAWEPTRTVEFIVPAGTGGGGGEGARLGRKHKTQRFLTKGVPAPRK